MKHMRTILFVFLVLVLMSCKQSVGDDNLSIHANVHSQVQKPTRSILSNIQSALAVEQEYQPILFATGRVEYDLRKYATLSARYNGRIEKVYVRYNNLFVSPGTRLFDIYSPEIIEVQKEYIAELNGSSNDVRMANQMRTKLRQYGMSDEQIHELDSTRSTITPLPIYSTSRGYIRNLNANVVPVTLDSPPQMSEMNSQSVLTASNGSGQTGQLNASGSDLNLKEGMYVQRGQPLLAIYDNTELWVILEIPQQYATLVTLGCPVELHIETDAVTRLYSVISFIEPVAIQGMSRIRARVYLNAEQSKSMIVGSIVNAKVTINRIVGVFVPRTAVVTLGKDAVVFVKKQGMFVSQHVVVGYRGDTIVQILKGLSGSEEYAVNAQYLVDSESFVENE